MVDEIEITGSSKRARCVKCNNYINRLEIRGKKNHMRAHPEYICEKCLIKEIKSIDIKTKEIKEEYKRLFNMTNNQKEKHLRKLKILKKL